MTNQIFPLLYLRDTVSLGHSVVQLRLIFRVVNADHTETLAGTDRFLVYVQRFNIVSQINQGMPASAGPKPDPTTGMFVLKRAQRSDKTMMGDIVHLSQVRTPVDLIPRFGNKADPRLTKETILEYGMDFLLNKYFDKELFYSLSQ